MISMTRQEIEQKMDGLAREYHDTHDPEIPEEISDWLGSLGRWNIEGAGFGLAPVSVAPKTHALPVDL
jgi:hypothetical protein